MARRRGHNEGAIYQTKAGTWRGAVTLSYDGDGRPLRKYLSGRTKADASRALARPVADHQKGVPIATSRPNVAESLELWLETSVRPRRRPRAYEAYATIVRLNLMPALRKIRPVIVPSARAENRASRHAALEPLQPRRSLRS